MPIPWLRILDTALGVTNFALRARARPAADAGDAADRGLLPGGGALGHLETRLAGVMVAALKEAFDRDSRRLELEREQMEAERRRAERLLRLELLRHAAEREIGRLRLLAGVAAASWLATLVFAARLAGGNLGARIGLGVGWAFLLAGLAASFVAQARISSAMAQAGESPDRTWTLPADTAAALAPWLVVAGFAAIGLSVLIS
jgi:hypothetical protein